MITFSQALSSQPVKKSEYRDRKLATEFRSCKGDTKSDRTFKYTTKMYTTKMTHTSHTVLVVLDHAQEDLVKSALCVCHLVGKSWERVGSGAMDIGNKMFLETPRMFNNKPVE